VQYSNSNNNNKELKVWFGLCCLGFVLFGFVLYIYIMCITLQVQYCTVRIIICLLVFFVFVFDLSVSKQPVFSSVRAWCVFARKADDSRSLNERTKTKTKRNETKTNETKTKRNETNGVQYSTMKSRPVTGLLEDKKDDAFF
jgi:hypothetical protein